MSSDVFQDNVVVLAGASMGIGEQLALQLASQGAKLVLAARSADKLEAVAVECRKLGGQAHVAVTDLADETQCRRLSEVAVTVYGRVDTLLYNAGRGYPQRFETLANLDNLRDEISVNYLGLVYCAYAMLPFLKQSRGRIVGVASFESFIALPATAGYNASKHAMRGFLNTLRAELRPTGITVTVAYPGAVRTARLYEVMGENVNHIPSMSPERCAEIILQAAAQRRRQVIMTWPGKLLVALYAFIPTILDRALARIADAYHPQSLL